MDAAPQSLPYRRIGTILVEKALITADQLAFALEEQQQTGRPLGEICVDRFKLDRLSLADALAEQWEEMQRTTSSTEHTAMSATGEHDVSHDVADGDPASERSAEDELRVLLEEAQAARSDLELKTDELGKRLAALEALVVGVRDALVELRASEPSSRDQHPGNGPAGNRRRSSRSAPRRSASA